MVTKAKSRTTPPPPGQRKNQPPLEAKSPTRNKSGSRSKDVQRTKPVGEKVALLGIKRDNNLMYFVKKGDVWATPRGVPGQPKAKSMKIADAGIVMDHARYLYYLDAQGDVARKRRG